MGDSRVEETEQVLERGDEDEGAAQGQEEVPWEKPVKGKHLGEGQQQGSDGEADASDNAADPRTVLVQNRADGQSADIRSYSSGGEHEIQSVVPGS